jgi:hypothetical protein
VFYDMTPREFAACWSGYAQRVKTQQQIVFEASRFNARAVVQAWSKKRIRSEDIARFPWDSEGKTKTSHGYVDADSVVSMLGLLTPN